MLVTLSVKNLAGDCSLTVTCVIEFMNFGENPQLNGEKLQNMTHAVTVMCK